MGVAVAGGRAAALGAARPARRQHRHQPAGRRAPRSTCRSRSAGALAYVGDPHFAQGDGEVALTAFEASLRATAALRRDPARGRRREFGELAGPLAETAEFLVPTGLDGDLDAACRTACAPRSRCWRRGTGCRRHTPTRTCRPRRTSTSRRSSTCQGVHARIRKADFGVGRRAVTCRCRDRAACEAFWDVRAGAAGQRRRGARPARSRPGPDDAARRRGGLLVGHDAIAAFRSGRGRRRRRGAGSVETTCRWSATTPRWSSRSPRSARGGRGLQTQLWQRIDGRWQITAAHVSRAALPALDRRCGGWSATRSCRARPDGRARRARPSRSRTCSPSPGYRIGAGNPAWLADARAERRARARGRPPARGGAAVARHRPDRRVRLQHRRHTTRTTAPRPTRPCPARSRADPRAGRPPRSPLGQADDRARHRHRRVDPRAGVVPGAVGAAHDARVGPRQGLLPLAPSFDTVGWLTRDGATLRRGLSDWCLDCERVDQNVYGESDDACRRRFVVPTEVLDAVEPETRAAFDALLERCERRRSRPSISCPIGELDDYSRRSARCRPPRRGAARRSGSPRTRTRSARGGGSVPRSPRAITAEDEASARRGLEPLGRRVDALVADAVLMLMPTVAGPGADAHRGGRARQRRARATLRMTAPAGIAGLPALSRRCSRRFAARARRACHAALGTHRASAGLALSGERMSPVTAHGLVAARPARASRASTTDHSPTLRRPVTHPGAIDPPPRLLMGPGPSTPTRACCGPWPRRSSASTTPFMTGTMTETQALYRGVFAHRRTSRPCSSTAPRAPGSRRRWCRLLEPGDRVLVPVFGRFGHLLARDRRARRRRGAHDRDASGARSSPAADRGRRRAASGRTLLADRARATPRRPWPSRSTSSARSAPRARRAALHRRHRHARRQPVRRPTSGASTRRPPGCRSAWAGPSGSAPVTLSPRAVAVIDRRKRVEAGIRDEPTTSRRTAAPIRVQLLRPRADPGLLGSASAQPPHRGDVDAVRGPRVRPPARGRGHGRRRGPARACTAARCWPGCAAWAWRCSATSAHKMHNVVAVRDPRRRRRGRRPRRAARRLRHRDRHIVRAAARRGLADRRRWATTPAGTPC